MRSRAGPIGVFIAIVCLAMVSTGCASTRAKLGGLINTAGELVTTTGEILTGIADVVLNGPAEDAKAATDSIGLTTPSPAPPPAVPPAPAPNPNASRPEDDVNLPSAPWDEPVAGTRCAGELLEPYTAPVLDERPPVTVRRRT